MFQLQGAGYALLVSLEPRQRAAFTKDFLCRAVQFTALPPVNACVTGVPYVLKS